MIVYQWQKIGGRQLLSTSDVQVHAGVRSIGELKVIGNSGAVAETPLGSFSFRGAGLDPVKRSYWKRRLSHDAAIVELANHETIGRFSVGPFHKTLRLQNYPDYHWRLSFLMNRGTWRHGDFVACTITQGFSWSEHGTITANGSENEISTTVLIFFGLYLMLSGRAG